MAYQTFNAAPSAKSSTDGNKAKSSKYTITRLTTSLLPCIGWISKYRLEYLSGDFMGAATVAAIYAPLSVSFALVAHAHPTSGLLSFIICTLVYAFLGHCPQMIIGPEAPGSLLVGIAVTLATKGKSNSKTEADPAQEAQLVRTVTATAGAVLLGAGVTRLGFMSCILNRPFVRGFILALGIAVVVEQAIPALGLTALARQDGFHNSSSIARKFVFVLANLESAHLLSAVMSISSFTLVMMARSVKVSLKARHPAIVLFPDRLLIVFLAATLTWIFQWQDQGLAILGSLRPGKDNPDLPVLQWPFQPQKVISLKDSWGTCLTLAVTGLFESMLTIHTLRKSSKADMAGESFTCDTNQELVALGMANAIAGCFNALPSFGGYGRSKLSVAAGGRSPMTSVFLSLMIAACLLFFLPAFYYVPNCVLAALLIEVGISMIEECPSDVAFFLRVKGWSELFLMVLVVGASFFISVSSGLMVGIILSLVALIRSSTHTGVSIHQAAACTSGKASKDNTSDLSKVLEQFASEDLMVVKITGSLTFASVEGFERRLDNTLAWQRRRRDKALARSSSDSPLDERQRPLSGRSIITLFNFEKSANIDNCATQALLEIVQEHRRLGIIVWFYSASDSAHHSHILRKLTVSGTLELCGGLACFLTSEQELLAGLEQIEHYRDEPFENSDIA